LHYIFKKYIGVNMNLIKRLEPQFPLIEKSLIVLVFLSVFLNYFISGIENTLSLGLIVLQVLLILFYAIQVQNKLYALIWVGFLLGILAYFISNDLNWILYFFFNSISYVAFGILILIKTIKDSIKHKSFELLNFIMGFLLVLQAALPILSKEGQILTFYAFALSFAIGTIIYNDNLWLRFRSEEKDIIKYILIVTLVLVLQSSFKYLNI
jgi:hypothetical protein